MRQQSDKIQEVVAFPVISNRTQPKTVTTIPESIQPTPNIIENENKSITPVYIVTSRKYNLRPHIIPPESPQYISMDKQQHLEYLRSTIIPQPTPIIPPRVPTARHQYNIWPIRQIAYYFTQPRKFSLAENIISSMEVNAVFHLVTGVSQEYWHLITEDEKITWKT